MRLSGWVELAPRKEAVTPKVLAVVEPMLAMLGCEADPVCWVAWGDDPSARYMVFAPTDAGLVQVNARVNVPGEGPRAGGKLIRWSRAQVGDLAIEMQGGHRILSFTLEGQILRGTDDSADAVAAFVLDVLAAIDGRPRRSNGGPMTPPRGSTKVVPPGPSDGAATTEAPRRKAVAQLEAPKERPS
jgi:hypothetical protein